MGNLLIYTKSMYPIPYTTDEAIFIGNCLRFKDNVLNEDFTISLLDCGEVGIVTESEFETVLLRNRNVYIADALTFVSYESSNGQKVYNMAVLNRIDNREAIELSDSDSRNFEFGTVITAKHFIRR